MEEQLYFYLGTAGIVATMAAAGLLARRFRKRERLRRALRRLRPTPLAQVGDGELVKVVGTVAPLGDALDAPLTGRACVYFRALLERNTRSDGAGGWLVAIREERRADFLLRDGGHTARVRLDGATLLLAPRLCEIDPKREGDFLLRHRRPDEINLQARWVERFGEEALLVGAKVAIRGRARRVVDPDGEAAGYREAPTRLVFDGELVVCDDPIAVG